MHLFDMRCYAPSAALPKNCVDPGDFEYLRVTAMRYYPSLAPQNSICKARRGDVKQAMATKKALFF